jgi:cell division protein FtsB
MISMRWIIAVLAIAGLGMQAQLWFAADGYRKTRDLRNEAQLQLQQNQRLKSRNQALEAEVLNLKSRHEAAEERARTNLGMIGKNETFYQVVPVAKSAD